MAIKDLRPITKFAISVTAAALVAATASAAWIHIDYLDKPVGPQSLPGDNLPPFGMIDHSGKLVPQPPMPPGAQMHGRERESNAAGPSLQDSIAGAQAAIAECRRLGAYGAATVVDVAGDARAMLSADGADGSHVFVAQRKAIVALEFEMPGIKVKERALAGDPKILSRITPNMFIQFGDYPITLKGKVIGAIGYSGGIDEPCAIAGWKEIEKRLGEPVPTP
jgi:uncharacterized protein GlcG (DUF336 family)